MDDIILAALQERISVADRARLDAYRSASPANEKHYQEIAELWHASQRPDPLIVNESGPPARLLSLIRGIPESVGNTEDTNTGKRASKPGTRPVIALPSRRTPGLVPTFAAIAGIAATVLFMSISQTRDNSVAPILSAAEFVTDTAETATARLEDGSVVRLAPKSRLRVAATSGHREVWLDGEGFFAVAHDASRPFRVRTRIGNIEVLGTRFDARVEGSNLRIVVTEGTVALTAGKNRVLVPKGHVATIGANGIPTVEIVQDPSALIGWMHDALIFQNTPLSDVAKELERRYAIRVLLPDSTVATRRVTAWFTHQDAQQVLTAICRAVDAHCTFENGIASIEP
jgi:transmembrane sensor